MLRLHGCPRRVKDQQHNIFQHAETWTTSKNMSMSINILGWHPHCCLCRPVRFEWTWPSKSVDTDAWACPLLSSLFVCLSLCLPICLSGRPQVCMFAWLSVVFCCLVVCWSSKPRSTKTICLSRSLMSLSVSVCLSVCQSVSQPGCWLFVCCSFSLSLRFGVVLPLGAAPRLPALLALHVFSDGSLWL